MTAVSLLERLSHAAVPPLLFSIAGAAHGQAASAASAASAAPAGAPLLFRSEVADAPFPVAGAALLLVLLAVAGWAWWTASRRGLRPWGLIVGKGSSPFLRGAGSTTGAARVVESLRLDVAARLYVVEWHSERLLVAVNGPSSPVVLSRQDAAAPASRNER